MGKDKRVIYILLSLMACIVIFTCTKVSWEDPFTDPNTLAFPIIRVNGLNPYELNVGDNYEELGATAIDTSDLDGDGVGDTTDITSTIEIVGGTISTDSPDEHIVKYYATGINDMKVKAERRVIVLEIQDEDSVKPVITLNGLDPTILFVGETYTEEGATALDNVDGDLSASIQIYGDNVITQKPDTFNVWYMVEDNARNIARKKRNVFIWEGDDRIPPELTLLGNVRDSIYLYEDYVDSGATAWDNVDGDLTDEIVAIDSVNNTVSGIYRIHYYVSDKAGNPANSIRYIYVFNIEDTIPPVITLLGDIVMSVGAGGAFADPWATAIDNVDGDITDRILDSGSVDMQKIGTYTVYYNIADMMGNQAEEKKRTVTVVDTIAPTIHINPPNPINIFVGTPYNEYGATANDNLDGDITHKLDTVGYVSSSINDSVNVNVGGEYRVHYRVQDDAGYETDSVRIVKVTDFDDTIPPVITLLGNNPMNLDISDPYNEPGATAWDNKDGDITNSIVINSDSVNTSTSGSYRVHYTVSDADNNTADKIRSVNVGIVAPDTVVIGTGTTTGQYLPMECYYGYSYTQSIYMKNEVGVSGPITIDSIAYYYTGSSSFSDAVRVYMGNTSQSSYAYTTDWVSAGSMTLVYNGNYSVSPSGWRKIRLSPSFTYNNSNNLVIAFDENTSGYHLDTDEFRCSSKSAARSMYFYADDTNPNPSSPPTSYNSTTTFMGAPSYCPNIKLYFHY